MQPPYYPCSLWSADYRIHQAKQSNPIEVSPQVEGISHQNHLLFYTPHPIYRLYSPSESNSSIGLNGLP